jgi:hypothetical protein
MVGQFDKIFGVTGTLNCFTEFEEKILEKHNITEKTYAPSVYGKSNRLDKPILIEDNKMNHFQAIATNMRENIDEGVACLVFF